MKINLQDLKSRINNDYDLFICSSSYESRCKTVHSAIQQISFKSTMIFKSTDYIKYISENINEFDKIQNIYRNFPTSRLIDISNYITK